MDSLFPYSKIMATKYNYVRAYYDLFEAMYFNCNSQNCLDYNLSCLEDDKRTIALNYLSEAIRIGDPSASAVVLDYYNTGKSYPVKELYENAQFIEIAQLNLYYRRMD